FYAIAFNAAADTVRLIAADHTHRGAWTGLLAILHSWRQNLFRHPHVHCIVPGGASSSRWTLACLPSRVLPAGPGPLASLPATIPAAPADLFRHWSAELLRRHRCRRRPGGFRRTSASSAPSRVGGLRQAALRRAEAGSRLS